MTETEFFGEIRSGSLSGTYFLWGEEDYTKNHRAAAVRDVVVGDDETFAAFNYIRFSFGDGECDLAAIESALMSPPLFSDQKLVDIWFANFDSVGEKTRTAFLDLLREFSEGGAADTVVLIRAAADGFDGGTAKKPSAFLAAASKFMKTVEFSFQSDAKLVRWMERHVQEFGVALDPSVAALISQRTGRSMYRLVGELEKVAAHAASHGRGAVTAEDVDACVTRTDDDDAFRLANCILEGNISEALSCLAVRMRRRDEPTLVLSQITKVFCDLSTAAAFIADGRQVADFAREMKMHEYKAGLYYRAAKEVTVEFLASAVARCVDADRLLKSTPIGYAAIERVICNQ